MSETDADANASADSGDRPNVLLLTAHDLGRFLGCYDRPVESPRLDAFHEEGVHFESAFAPAPQCGPSRASLMTGMVPHNHGLMGHHWLGWSLNDHVTTLPEFLRDAGYATHVHGVQHMAADAEAVGYEHAHGPLRAAEDEHEAVVDTLESAADGEDAFFVAAGFFEAHRHGGMDNAFRMHSGDYDLPAAEAVEVPPYLPDRPGVREDVAGLHGAVGALDRSVGRILDAVDDLGLAGETLVIFTTDHGLAMPRAKGMCYDAGLETALAMRYPGEFETDRCAETVSNVDLLPTIADLLDLEVPNPADGHSFLPLLRGEEDAYAERTRIHCEITYHDKYNPIRGVRTERFKYVRTFDDQPLVYLPYDVLWGPAGREVVEEYYGSRRPAEELYDLAADPHERENLAGDPAYAGVLNGFRSDVANWMEGTDDPLADGDVPVPEAHVDVLKKYPYTG
jgi:arylsulfatase A-like enzyme